MGDVLALQNPAGTAAPSEDGRVQGFHRDAAQLPLYHPEGHRLPPRIELMTLGLPAETMRCAGFRGQAEPYRRPARGMAVVRRSRWADRRHANNPCRRISPVAHVCTEGFISDHGA